MNIQLRIRNIFQNTHFFYGLIFFIALIAYGSVGFRLSFFYDDLSTIRYFTTLNFDQFINSYSDERILLGQFYSVTMALIPENPLVWQALGILLRWLIAVGLLELLNLIWPGKRTQNKIAALFSVVFPGFSYHWIILTYSHAYLLLLFGLWSILLMLKILENNKFVILIPALLLGLVNMMVTEYFLGLEFFRYIALYIYCGGNPALVRSATRKIVTIVFLGMDVGYLFLRFILFESSKYSIHATIESYLSVEGMRNLFLQFWNCSVGNWINSFINIRFEFQGILNLFSIILSLVLAIFVFFWLIKSKSEIQGIDQKEKSPFLFRNRIVIFVFTTGLCMAPFLGGGFPIVLTTPYDRFQIAFILTSSVLITDLLFLIRSYKTKVAIISVLVGLSACSLFQTSITFYREQQSLIHFLDQLTWRIPDLSPNTLLVTDSFPFTYYSENTITATVNQIFDPLYGSSPSKFALAAVDGIIRDTNGEYREGEEISFCDRTLCFNGNTDRIIYFEYFPSACTRFLDTIITPPIYIAPDSPIGMTSVIENSQINLIRNLEVTRALPWYLEPFDHINPEEDWCYYFQRAELARQFENWDQVVELYDLAFERGLQPSNETEYYPLLDAYNNLSQFEIAFSISQDINNEHPLRHDGLCFFWRQALGGGGFSSAEYGLIENHVNEINCH